MPGGPSPSASERGAGRAGPGRTGSPKRPDRPRKPREHSSRTRPPHTPSSRPHYTPPSYEPDTPAYPPLAQSPAPGHALTYVPEPSAGADREQAARPLARRVLPMGTGLTLMGLGLGFIALRLRRRGI